VPPRNRWSLANQRAFFDQLAMKLNLQRIEDWQSLRVATVVTMGGAFIKRTYNGSLINGMCN
jgi:hypothetical protein